jgi:predicted RecB family nuclease
LDSTHYPEPVEQCDVCRWFARCNARRRADDHLSFIAGIGRIHREELTAQGYSTLAAAAAIPLPIAFKPSRGSRETYERIRQQARVQHEQRTSGKPVYELLEVPPARDGEPPEPHGLARLPEPSPGDMFLDLEGARFAREGGREYLFGLSVRGAGLQACMSLSGAGLRAMARPRLAIVSARAAGYVAAWAFTDAEERVAFEATIDRIMAAVAAHPDAHVYHFGSYEPAALKRLMGRYATRGEQLDELLRAERFVDLHTVVRQSLRAGVESYSIKQLEQYYGFVRTMPLRDVNLQLQAIELALEGNAPGAIPEEATSAVQAYNEDDCRSTEALRDWLEALRAAEIAKGILIPRPEPRSGEASEQVGELEARQQAARARLLQGLPDEAADSHHPEHPRWLLAYLIDWHRRENKSAWWERYRLEGPARGELVDEPRAVAGLVHVERVKE